MGDQRLHFALTNGEGSLGSGDGSLTDLGVPNDLIFHGHARVPERTASFGRPWLDRSAV